VHAVLADRAEQHSREPAVSPVADHQQVGTLGRAHQHVRGVPLDHQRLDHHVGRDAADLGERLEQELARTRSSAGSTCPAPLFEPVIDDTVRALEQLAPDLIFPAHCTGWRATHAIARRLSGAFIQNSVGTAFHLTGRVREACGQDALALARITGGAPAWTR